MQVWKRRLAFVLAVGSGSLGLTLSSAGAQTSPPPTFPPFPTFPDFPTIPSTSPPPTMPPPTSPPSTTPPPTMPPPTFTIPTFPPPPTMPPPTTTPPPTMPPPTSTPPPTMPPPTVPNIDNVIDDFLSRLQDRLDEGSDTFEELQAIVNEIIADFHNN